jgi:adenine-specific DNA-methyltransferase
MEKLKLHSSDFTFENIAKLAELFPNCVTESRDDDGTLKRSVDFDQLRQELSSSVVEGPRERYQLNWPGKYEALLTANAPIAKTLRPCRDESVDFDDTKNLFIEGDNLDALKLLQETYLGKVKMIYIDPPYNTGNDFIYEDDFTENAEKFLKRSNQKDEEGNPLVTNTESNGRFHSDWLSMIYPRLKLARNLLSDDGVMFISIDDNEQANLKRMCDEVFGDKNFVSTVIWEKRYSPQNAVKWFSEAHDFLLVYAKNKLNWYPNLLERSAAMNARYRNLDNDPRGVWKPADATAQGGHGTKSQFYVLTAPNGKQHSLPNGRCWVYTEPVFQQMVADNRIWFGADGNNVPAVKRFLSEVKQGTACQTIWKYGDVGHNQEGKKEVNVLFPESAVFETPKPVRLLKRILHLSTEPNSIVLDFFAGSATTAHAVMQLNAEDGGNRKFIMVQLPEICDEKSSAFKEGYKNIAEISKERIRRAGKKIKKENAGKDGIDQLDTGFRVLKVDSSNMKDVYYSPDTVTQDDLFSQADNIREDRTPEDLLFQVLLDWGVDLSLPVIQETIDSKKVFFVDENALAACFDTGISEAFVKELAARKPLRVVFRDSSFDNDSVKINVEQIFKLVSPGTEVKSI